jgi:hypothetical protein
MIDPTEATFTATIALEADPARQVDRPRGGAGTTPDERRLSPETPGFEGWIALLG